VHPGVPRIQIAGVLDAAEAAMLADAGADALGLPLRLAVHAEDLTEARAARIVAALPDNVLAVCITYLEDPDEILGLVDALGAHGVQLHGRVEPDAARAVRIARPDLLIIRSLVVGHSLAVGTADAEALLAEARAFAPFADAFLTDSFDPATGATGATGRTHDWAVSARLAREAGRPLILAGGLNPDNVSRAVAAARPWGVDAHTGLEGPDGRKDPALVRAFVAKARQALAALSRPTCPGPA